MSAQIKTLVQRPLSLFVTTTCPFCRNARALATKKGVSPDIVELDRTQDGKDVRRELTELTKQHTVPYVFSNGKFIGGFSELSKEPQSFWDALK